MALLKCPECGKEVSDKAAVCIHCGYPLASMIKTQTPHNACLINGIEYDLSEIIQDVNSFFKNNPNPSIIEKSNFGLSLNRRIRKLTGINDIAGATLATEIISSKSIPQCFDSNDYPDPPSLDKSKIYCPKCGSTAITTGARGVNWTLGLIGASKTVNRCGNCGHVFKPRG